MNFSCITRVHSQLDFPIYLPSESLLEAIEQGSYNDIQLSLKEYPTLLKNWKHDIHPNPLCTLLQKVKLSAKEKYDCARLLLEFGADVNKGDSKGDFPLLVAIHSQQLEIVELLLSYNADLKQKDLYGNSLLITAIQSAIQNENKLAIIQCLLKYGADVNQLTAFDSSPLLIAIMCNYPFAIHELFKYKASAQEKDPCGCPLLRLTLTWMKNEAITKLFLQHGADPNSQDKHGESTFCVAIKMGTVSLVKTFLEHGANLMGKDMKGNIPLMVAAQYKKMEISKLLFERMCEKQGIVETLCSLPCLAICWEFVLEKIENVIKAHGHERMQLLQRSNELIKNALMQSLDRIYIETLQKKISQAYFGGLSSL